MEGLVIKSTGNRYKVLNSAGEVVDCAFKGKFKISGLRSTNPIAVGDRVSYRLDAGEITGLITEIHERKNYIIRKSSNLSKETHILAANIDLAFLVLSISHPSTPPGFIDRFLATAEAYRIPVDIIINKTDRMDEQDREAMEELISIYEPLGYPCHRSSIYEAESLEGIKDRMRDKICLFTGNSGVGKSSLANAIDSRLTLKTDHISHYHSKGKHTTTFAQMYPLEQGGYLIDTPGIKGFGVYNFQREEIGHFFREIFQYSSRCQFNNCTHTHEPNCAVRAAVEEGEIHALRYENYLKIFYDDNDKYRKAY